MCQYPARHRTIADEYGPILGIGNLEPMASLHQAGIERHDVKKDTEPEFFLHQAPERPEFGPTETWVKEQLARVIAGLAVNVHCAGIIRSNGVLKPEWIGKPAVGLPASTKSPARS